LIPFENDLKTKIMGLTPAGRVMAFLRFSKRGIGQKILHQLKYKNKPELGKAIGMQYGMLLKQCGFTGVWDVIVPVPLHPAKLRRRGYNQSEMFAEGISRLLEVPVGTLLSRNLNTQTQTRKSRLQRWENVSEVFSLVTDPLDVAEKRILLVDDVMTTGATLAACAHALWKYNPACVDFAVIAAGK
jgi:ComF family protein